MHDALEKLADLIKRANVNNQSPGSWACILPSGEATYAGEKFANIDKMLAAVMAMAYSSGPPKRVHKSPYLFPLDDIDTCCFLPGATRQDCQHASGRNTPCRCKCHDHKKKRRY